ncbi:hypothetical protein AALA99_13780 [Anaerotruncus colihominis]|uniref:hypothetical protein n=1 Tax=Anaerotruncus colihominis TaxID=169435 RepID=UPI003514C05F
MSYNHYNPNPAGRNVGDCTVRAISAAAGQAWEETYIGLCVEGLSLYDMPSSNAVWGAYLENKGFKRRMMPDTCPNCYTVARFAKEHPSGIYILALSGHVVCIKDGDWLDSWDSGNEIVLYYWERTE